MVEAVAQGAGPLIEWLADRYGLPFDVVDNFNYPGHSALRMHGAAEPHRAGADRPPAQRGGSQRHRHSDRARGRAAGGGCGRPHPRHRGAARRRRARAHRLRRAWCSPATAMAAIRSWSAASFRRWRTRSISAIPATAAMRCSGARRSGAQLAHLGGYQGHGSVATPHNILISLGGDHAGRHPGQRARPPLLRRDARLFGSGRRRAAPAGRDRLGRVRCAHRRRRAAVRGFPQCRASRRRADAPKPSPISRRPCMCRRRISPPNGTRSKA